MNLKDKKIGFIITGSFSTFKKIIPKIQELIEKEAIIIPVMSFNAYSIDSKYGTSKEFIEKIEDITGKKIIKTIKEAERIGRKRITDIAIVAPCTRKHNFQISK